MVDNLGLNSLLRESQEKSKICECHGIKNFWNKKVLSYVRRSRLFASIA
jgi:hypothetical protein